MTGLLCYCRPGFEPELAAELTDRAAQAGHPGYARTERNSAHVVFVCDDGAVVHLNGTEVARFNMPAGAVGHATPAVTAIGGDDETLWRALSLDPTRLVTGENVLAVEVHQSGPTSSDLSFDAALEGFTATSFPRVQPTVTAGALVLSWPAWAADWTPQASIDLVNWQPLTIVPVPVGGVVTLTLTSPPRTTFFRLVAP